MPIDYANPQPVQRTLAAPSRTVVHTDAEQQRQDATVRALERALRDNDLKRALAAAERYLHEHPERVEGRVATNTMRARCLACGHKLRGGK